ncbi:unnamed protein product [Caenorhabditis angaria]|uniref:SET domain-containing protein n=1 Tax=Caenorhabditis angaria TaxID=860376 RepID=A0A9P1IIY6_9PELO|nr:unnamed protein product [Caenorhabditis angaria]
MSSSNVTDFITLSDSEPEVIHIRLFQPRSIHSDDSDVIVIESESDELTPRQIQSTSGGNNQEMPSTSTSNTTDSGRKRKTLRERNLEYQSRRDEKENEEQLTSDSEDSKKRRRRTLATLHNNNTERASKMTPETSNAESIPNNRNDDQSEEEDLPRAQSNQSNYSVNSSEKYVRRRRSSRINSISELDVDNFSKNKESRRTRRSSRISENQNNNRVSDVVPRSSEEPQNETTVSSEETHPVGNKQNLLSERRRLSNLEEVEKNISDSEKLIASGSILNKAQHSKRTRRSSVLEKDNREESKVIDTDRNSEHEPSVSIPDNDNDTQKDSRASRIKRRRSIIYTDTHKSKLTPSQFEAERGNLYGSFKVPGNNESIPKRKFGKKDQEKYGKCIENWPLQAVFKTSDPQQYVVLYEGWSAETASIQEKSEIAMTARVLLKESQVRDEIIQSIEEKTGRKFWPKVEEMIKHPKASFWVFADLTYFHGYLQVRNRLAPIYYFGCDRNVKKYPVYTCIHQNLVEKNVSDMLNKNYLSIHIDKVLAEHGQTNEVVEYDKRNGSRCCGSPKCICDLREELLFKTLRTNKLRYRMNYDKNGRLKIDDKVLGDQYVIECSDVCGCDISCPNRTIQRGQKVPLVIFYEDEIKGYGVRAGGMIKRGELIAEYTGVIRLYGDKSYTSESYSFESNMVMDENGGIHVQAAIDSLDKGNVSRFINHSCTPNSIFVEAFSRKTEDSILIPRAGVFATADIELGDEITVSYYSKEALAKAAKKQKGLECRCYSKDCLGWIPGKR